MKFEYMGKKTEEEEEKPVSHVLEAINNNWIIFGGILSGSLATIINFSFLTATIKVKTE